MVFRNFTKKSLFKHQVTCVANTEKVMLKCTECPLNRLVNAEKIGSSATKKFKWAIAVTAESETAKPQWGIWSPIGNI